MLLIVLIAAVQVVVMNHAPQKRRIRTRFWQSQQLYLPSMLQGIS